MSADRELLAFIRDIEAVEDDIRDLNQSKSTIYKDAAGRGYDKKAMRKVVAARRLAPAERDEQDALFDAYMDALDRAENGVAHARVEIIEKFDAETGEIIEPNSPQSQEVVTPVARAKPAHAESQGGEISATHSNSQAAVLPVAAKPEPVGPPPSAGSGTLSPATVPPVAAPEPTPVPTNGSGAPILNSDERCVQVSDAAIVATPLAARGSEESAALIPDEQIVEFLRKDHPTARVTEDA